VASKGRELLKVDYKTLHKTKRFGIEAEEFRRRDLGRENG